MSVKRNIDWHNKSTIEVKLQEFNKYQLGAPTSLKELVEM